MDYTGGFKALFEYIMSERDKVESIVVLPKGSQCIAYLKKEKISYYEVPFQELRKSLWSFISYLPCLLINAWKIKKIAVKESVDVLHSNDLYNLSLYVVKYIFKYKAPLVTHLRLMPASYPGLFYNTWKRFHLAYADALVAVSEAVKKAYDGDSRINVVYDLFEQEERYPAYQPFKFSSERKEFRFLYLANYTRGKGQDLAIDAFEKCLIKNSNCTLTFAGGLLGKDKNRLFKEELIHSATAKGLLSKVVFEEFVEDVELKMKQYDCILNFSLSESFSFTSYEALQFGIPLIASDCGGPTELFKNGESGFLVENGSVNQMAEAMYQISTDIELVNMFSSNSKKHIFQLSGSVHRFDFLSNLFFAVNIR